MSGNEKVFQVIGFIDQKQILLDISLLSNASIASLKAANEKLLTEQSSQLMSSTKNYGRIPIGIPHVTIQNTIEVSKEESDDGPSCVSSNVINYSTDDYARKLQGAIRDPMNFRSSMKRNWRGLFGLPKRDRAFTDRCSPPLTSSGEEMAGNNETESAKQVETEEELLNAYSDASSDGCSVDDSVSWKNDLNRGERLLPLKRLKKGYTSLNCKRRESAKPTDWTDHITLYDKIVSVALDHANYARTPNFITSPPVINSLPDKVDKKSLQIHEDISPDSARIVTTDATEMKKSNTNLPTPSVITTSQPNPMPPKNSNLSLNEKGSELCLLNLADDATVQEIRVVVKESSDLPKRSKTIVNITQKIPHKPRGRPKGSVKQISHLASVRSYRQILRRSRLGRPIRSVVRDIASEVRGPRIQGDPPIKRPVGRPKKYRPELTQPHSSEVKINVPKFEEMNLTERISLDSNLALTNEEDNLNKQMKNPLSAVNLSAPVQRTDGNNCSKLPIVTESVKSSVGCSEIELSSTIIEPSDKIDAHVKDRLLCISNDVGKRPKGRPRIHPIAMKLCNSGDPSQMKRKRGRPPKIKHTLLQSLRKNEQDSQCPPSDPVEESKDCNQDGINLDREGSRQSSPSSDTLVPNNLLSQLSKRSSLRQVECAFRYREIVVKRLENFIHIVLTSNTRVKNGLNCQVLYELRTALLSAKGDSRCHCVMLSGTGGVFCSGVDLISLSNDRTKATADKLSCAIRDFCKSLMTFTKPLVAAVNGAAVGLGVSMLPYFDLVYATDKATFYSPYAKLGQVPEGGATFLLPTVMGYARANGLLFEGRKLTATEAYDCGIVTQVLWPATFMEEVIPRVQALASRPSQALESTKALVRFHALSKLEVTLDTECRLLHQHWSSEECRQAIRNFLQNEEVV